MRYINLLLAYDSRPAPYHSAFLFFLFIYMMTEIPSLKGEIVYSIVFGVNS